MEDHHIKFLLVIPFILTNLQVAICHFYIKIDQFFCQTIKQTYHIGDTSEYLGEWLYRDPTITLRYRHLSTLLSCKFKRVSTISNLWFQLFFLQLFILKICFDYISLVKPIFQGSKILKRDFFGQNSYFLKLQNTLKRIMLSCFSKDVKVI
jgi:hypothetical protein